MGVQTLFQIHTCWSWIPIRTSKLKKTISQDPERVTRLPPVKSKLTKKSTIPGGSKSWLLSMEAAALKLLSPCSIFEPKRVSEAILHGILRVFSIFSNSFPPKLGFSYVDYKYMLLDTWEEDLI